MGRQPFSQSGAVATEFLIVILPLFVLVLGLIQLAQLFTANLMVEYAAHAAWRSAVVVFSDGSRPHPNDAPQPPSEAEGQAMVQRAAAYVMTGVSPQLDRWIAEEALDLPASVGSSLRLGSAAALRKYAYALQATQVVVTNTEPGLHLRVTYAFRCSIPLVAALVCRPLRDLSPRAREDLQGNPQNLLFRDATPGYYLALSAET